LNGEQLLEKLHRLTPEQLKLEVVGGDFEGWFYDLNTLSILCVKEGRETDGEPNTIALS
jgi:hypothetical protein